MLTCRRLNSFQILTTHLKNPERSNPNNVVEAPNLEELLQQHTSSKLPVAQDTEARLSNMNTISIPSIVALKMLNLDCELEFERTKLEAFLEIESKTPPTIQTRGENSLNNASKPTGL